MNKLLEAALDYADKGWPIFPVRANKQPYEDTNGVLDATTSEKQIKKWWKEHPTANIALDVGGANMMVLDLDPGHDMKELEENIGGKLKRTKLAARTPRGGMHLYYELADGEVVPPSASKVAKKMDIRSFHSYVLLEPSKTPDGVYSWESEGKPAYRDDGLVEVASSAKERDAHWDDWVIEPDIAENVALAIKWLSEDAKPAVVGQGGDHMTYSTAAMCKSFGLSEQMALDLMWEHWCPRCTPPWNADMVDNLEQKIVNGYSYNTSPPGNMTPAYKTAKANELFSPVSRDTTGGGREVRAGRFRIVDRDGMEEIKPPEWLIEGAIPQNSYSLLVGPRGTFKTFIALDMGLSVATGAPFEDWYGPWGNIGKEGPVLFAAGEGRGNIVNRVRAWEKVHMEGERTKNFYLVDPVPNPTTEDVTPFIEAALDYSHKYSMVIIDTVGRSMQGLNENSQQDASTFTRMVETIQHELDCAVLAIHHTGHDQSGRGRGSSVFGADVDAEFILERKDKEHLIKLKNTKQKDAPEWEDAKVIHVKEVHIGKKETSLVAVNPTEKQAKEIDTPKAAKRGTDKDKRIDQQMLGKMVHDKLKTNKAKVWGQKQLAEALAVMRLDGEDTPTLSQGFEAIKKQLTKLRESPHPSHKYYDPDKGRGGSWEWKS